MGMKWSRDRLRHVTLKSQGREPNMLRAQNLENGWRYRLVDNGAPIKCLPVMTSHDPEGQGRDLKMFCAQYLQNGWRFRLRRNGAPIGYGAWQFKWSRDRGRHVTRKGQGGDPIMFVAHYLENSWRYRLGCNGVPIGNKVWRVEWSGARCRRVCRSSYSELITYCHSTVTIDKIAW